MPAITAKIGIKTLRVYLQKSCKIIAKFRSHYSQYMTPTQIAVFDNLVTVCEGVVDLITELVD